MQVWLFCVYSWHKSGLYKEIISKFQTDLPELPMGSLRGGPERKFAVSSVPTPKKLDNALFRASEEILSVWVVPKIYFLS